MKDHTGFWAMLVIANLNKLGGYWFNYYLWTFGALAVALWMCFPRLRELYARAAEWLAERKARP